MGMPGKTVEHASDPPRARPVRPEAERKAIQEQLGRMLANPLFRNSRRYPNLLRYVVEHALQGQTGELKERTLGVEVFAREPDYDTNLDPVVRTTAGEIRKRIAQYYHEPGHEDEIRIDLPPGSYIPEFRVPSVEPVPAPVAVPDLAIVPARRSPTGYWLLASILPALLMILLWSKPWVTKSTLDRFWTPVVEVSNPVLLCVGQRPNARFSQSDSSAGNLFLAANEKPVDNSDSALTAEELYLQGSQNLTLPDVTTLARIAGVLQARGKSYRIRGESITSLSDLRDGPVVLIGAFNNDWTIRLTGPQRFSFEQSGDVRWIKDHQNPTRKDWAVSLTTPYLKLTEDYALISRVLDPTTDRMVVVAAGLFGYGTMAAGEFLTNPDYLAAIAKTGPKNWEHKNLQVVVGTKVISGNSGPPRVVATYFW
ncbi:MAG: hypothetical protein C5B51_00375 [Terriglobia bacterium]|nr:MAG: hypothetical protein C5B51_00375 [Terriglobia bacterium]